MPLDTDDCKSGLVPKLIAENNYGHVQRADLTNLLECLAYKMHSAEFDSPPPKMHNIAMPLRTIACDQ